MTTPKPERLIVIGPTGSPAEGWKATLETTEHGRRRVQLSPVYSWNDINDHAATFDAAIAIGRTIIYALVKAGRGPLSAQTANTLILDS